MSPRTLFVRVYLVVLAMLGSVSISACDSPSVEPGAQSAQSSRTASVDTTSTAGTRGLRTQQALGPTAVPKASATSIEPTAAVPTQVQPHTALTVTATGVANPSTALASTAAANTQVASAEPTITSSPAGGIGGGSTGDSTRIANATASATPVILIASATPGSDPDLEPGFPVKVKEFPLLASLAAQRTRAYILVGNIDDDPELEILAPSARQDKLYAWNADGSAVAGWPLPASSTTNASTTSTVTYGTALGRLSSTGLPGVSDVFMAAWQSSPGPQPAVERNLVAYSGSAALLSGWPVNMETSPSAPTTLGDVDGDGLDEIFVSDGKGTLHGLKADGSELPGWPRTTLGTGIQAPALADLDADGKMEIVSSGGNNSSVLVQAYRLDGTPLPGFPVQVPQQHTGVAAQPAIGDVDGDGKPEIVALSVRRDDPGSVGFVNIISAQGTIRLSITIPGRGGGGLITPVLADLDCDGQQEIIVQTSTTIYAWRSDGTDMPGWPQLFWTARGYAAPLVHSYPVVGDIDGDGMPDVVTTVPRPFGAPAGDEPLDGELRAYSHDGKLLPRFPKSLPLGLSAVPAIADTDRDGRNEIIVASTGIDRGGSAVYQTPEVDKLWVYDLGAQSGYGAVQWSQFGGGAQHRGSAGSGTSCVVYAPGSTDNSTPSSVIVNTPRPRSSPPTATPTVTSTPTVTPTPTNTPDQDLRPGFPLKSTAPSGSQALPYGAYAVVGNIDAGPAPEIIVASSGGGPLSAWHADGSAAQGWPITAPSSVLQYFPSLGNLSAVRSAQDVVFGRLAPGESEQSYNGIIAVTGAGNAVPGWPLQGQGIFEMVASPPVLVDVNGDGVDEAFFSRRHGTIYGYRADGTPLPGWPVGLDEPNHWYRLAAGDLDGDGAPDIVAATSASSIYAFKADGSVLPGFPVSIPDARGVDTMPVIGDVDGDGKPEIVAAALDGDTYGLLDAAAYIISGQGQGQVERKIKLAGRAEAVTFFQISPALADMDCDGTPEIIVPVRNVLNVIKGDGTALPGWPVTLKGNAADDGRENPIGSSGPVVGDVNGDGMPDIVLTIDGEVRAYDRRGQLLPRFPKTPDGFSAGAVPAIADLNLDGRNEIVVAGTSSVNRSGGEVSKIWVYDLHGSGQYGAVQWGQLAGGSAHQGYFTPGTYCSP